VVARFVEVKEVVVKRLEKGRERILI